LQLLARALDRPLSAPFGLSRGVIRIATNVFVSLTGDGITGRGEGAPNARYGESQAQALHWLGRLCWPGDPLPRRADEIDGLVRRIAPHLAGGWAARCALEMALGDWLARRLGQSLGALWGCPGSDPITSLTIPLDQPAAMAERARVASSRFTVLKVKLGGPRDRAAVEAIRAATSLPLRVDLNEGWTDPAQALGQIDWLADRGVVLVEQPLPAGRLPQMAWLKRRSPLPLFADEDCRPGVEMASLAEGYHGVNIKLDKCGGIGPARAQIAAARAAGLQVMLGCMVSSSLSITAAAHLAALADVVDLDGHLLLADDPFVGVVLREGRLRLPGGPGIGARRRVAS
jgi:L-alanine-DL-glutamate epimerase-like enolase superfamily enzyme